MNQIILADDSAQHRVRAESDEIKLATFVHLIWRRRWIAVAAIALALVGSVLYLLTATPTYNGAARVYVQQSGPRLIGDHREELALAQTDQFAAAQADIITSASVLARTASLVEHLDSLQDESNLFQHLTKRVSAEVDKKTQLITVYYEGSTPEDSAKVANAVVEAYMSFERSERRAAAERTIAALESDRKQRVAELASRTREMVEMQSKYGAISLGDEYTTVITDHLTKLSSALIEARLKLIDARSAYEEAVQSLRVDAEALRRFEANQDVETFSASSSDEDAADRLQMISILQVKLREAQRLSGPRHPQVVAYRTQLEQVVMSYVASLKQSMLAAESKVDDIENRLKTQQQMANNLTGTAMEFARVRNETRRLEKLIEAINDRINEVQVTAGSPLEMVRMVDAARPPEHAASPRPMRVLGVGVIAGMVLAVGMAFLAEWHSPRVRSIEQVESIVNAPILGAIPRMQIADPAARYRAAMLEPAGVCAEAYRMVRTSFLGRNRGQCKTIAVTSAVAQEGKSTVAHNLAIVLAQTGQRVLLIDADMRNSAQHSLFESPDAPGLSNILDGTANLHGVILPGSKLAPDIVPAGRAPHNPAELLNSPLFNEAIRAAADAYDFIVIDTPPVGCVADARIIAAQCDRTIQVLRAEFSNPRSVAAAFHSLQLVGAHVGGVVVNDVQAGAFSGYGMNEAYPYRAPSAADTTVERVPQPIERPRAVLGNKPLAG